MLNFFSFLKIWKFEVESFCLEIVGKLFTLMKWPEEELKQEILFERVKLIGWTRDDQGLHLESRLLW